MGSGWCREDAPLPGWGALALYPKSRLSPCPLQAKPWSQAQIALRHLTQEVLSLAVGRALISPKPGPYSFFY